MFLPLRDDNPLHRIGFQFVTVALILACTVVWLVQWLGGDQFDAELVFRLGMIPVTVLGELRREPDMVTVTPWLTIVTSMFLHGGFWHLFGNMMYLWIFGDNVEDAMGHWRFALFYLLCGAVAALTHAAVEPASQIPYHRRERRGLGRARRLLRVAPEAGCLDSRVLHADPLPGLGCARRLDRLSGHQRAHRRPSGWRGRLVRPHRRLRCRRAAGGAAQEAGRATFRPGFRPRPQADALPATA